MGGGFYGFAAEIGQRIRHESLSGLAGGDDFHPVGAFQLVPLDKQGVVQAVQSGLQRVNHTGCQICLFSYVTQIGNGIGGWGRVGIGYRFNAKKK